MLEKIQLKSCSDGVTEFLFVRCSRTCVLNNQNKALNIEKYNFYVPTLRIGDRILLKLIIIKN